MKQLLHASYCNSLQNLETPHMAHAAIDEEVCFLNRSIRSILDVMRKELAMEIVFFSSEVGGKVVGNHAVRSFETPGHLAVLHTRCHEVCQYGPDKFPPAVTPEVFTNGATHEVALKPLVPGTHMTASVRLRSSALYGTLCCLNSGTLSKLEERYHKRLQMSARQIARLIDEAGGR